MDSKAKLLDSVTVDSADGIAAISRETAYQLGALVRGLEANTNTVAELVRSIGSLELSHKDLTHDLLTLKKGLEMANKDIMSITSTLASLNFDVDSKRDLEHLRKLRRDSDDNRPIISAVKIALAVAICAAVSAWGWSAIQSKAIKDLQQGMVNGHQEK